MATNWPMFEYSGSHCTGTWTGPLRPTETSPNYTVQIKYSPPRRPAVHVLAPELQHPGGKQIPHTFSGDRLCLHLPGQWTTDMWIADTIVKWAAWWLFFYESWLITDEWFGEGHEPGSLKLE